jgi:dihydroorotate dehydrogenase
MSDFYTLLFRALLARIDAEQAHRMAIRVLAGATSLPGGRRRLRGLAGKPDDRMRLSVWDVPFVNPLGVAAGLDKNGEAVEALLALGFGHVEVGTVTLLPQQGNDRPRVWRVLEQRAAINAMGFPSEGAAAVRERLIRLRPRGVIGINIGKNRDTSIERAADDYAGIVPLVFPLANYIAVNVSSPNTPGLRSLQLADELERVLTAVQTANQLAAELADRNPKPILVKIAPDLSDDETVAVAAASIAGGARGIIATNTTTSRAGLPARYRDLPGGLSGAPLKERATQVTRVLYRVVGDRIPIVGVGGIATGADAVERIRAGATLVQLYTSFAYAGPALPGRILREMSDIADREGWSSVRDIVGIDTS